MHDGDLTAPQSQSSMSSARAINWSALSSTSRHPLGLAEITGHFTPYTSLSFLNAFMSKTCSVPKKISHMGSLSREEAQVKE